MDFGRVVTAMATPFHPDFSLDVEGAQRLAEHLLANGSDSLVVTGTTGESPTLTLEEKLRMYAAIREVTKGTGKYLIAGTGSNCTAASVELSVRFESDTTKPAL